MATKTMTQHICDRCEKVYNETNPQAQTTKAPAPMLVLEFDAPAAEGASSTRKSVKFDDLCPKCQGRISDLVDQIKLEKDAPKEPQSDGKPLDQGAKPTENKRGNETKASDAKVTTT